MSAAVQSIPAEPTAIEPGFTEYETRTAIRDLIRLHGFETARQLVAGYLNDEADRAARKRSADRV